MNIIPISLPCFSFPISKDFGAGKSDIYVFDHLFYKWCQVQKCLLIFFLIYFFSHLFYPYTPNCDGVQFSSLATLIFTITHRKVWYLWTLNIFSMGLFRCLNLRTDEIFRFNSNKKTKNFGYKVGKLYTVLLIKIS